MLCLHGFQDNCASFDRLVPLLDGNSTYLCPDWPNHGRSSGTPYGVRWTMENYALTVKRVLDYVRWTTFVCIGHSMGGQIGTLIAALYPEHVEKLVLLDAAGPVEMYPKEIVSRARRSLDELLKLEDRILSGVNRSPEYGRPEEALGRVQQRIYGALFSEPREMLTHDSGMTLMARYLRPGPGGKYVLANDVRLKVTYSNFFSARQLKNIVESVTCPTLLMGATESQPFFNSLYKVIVGLYAANPNFRLVMVDGNHDVHLNYAHRVASLVEDFLNDNSCKL